MDHLIRMVETILKITMIMDRVDWDRADSTRAKMDNLTKGIQWIMVDLTHIR